MRRRRLLGAPLGLLVGACGGVGTHTIPPSPTPAATATTSVSRVGVEVAEQEDHPSWLSPARSVDLGLSAPGTLTAALWSEPQAVAAHFVLTDSSYAASEDPTVVNARRGVFAAARLAADLNASSSGATRLEELRRRGTRSAGEVESITTVETTDLAAVVELTVRVTLTTNDRPPEIRLRFYRLTLGRDIVGGRWLVVRAEQS